MVEKVIKLNFEKTEQMIKNNLDATKIVYFTPDSYWASKYDTQFGNEKLRKGFNISIFGDVSPINHGLV